ncbi:MAG TPA: squalene/phytoene synthase family protein, partial [Polyangia bacterium]
DLEGRRYETLSDLRGYCARVAATVGVLVTCLLGERRAAALARACDLGVAMQLTNIARDVGEDARRGRVYLPASLLARVGGDRPAAVRALLERADAHYRAADRGVPLLPGDCRFAIASARNIYSAIGAAIARNGYDSITRRAYVPLPRKLLLVARALPARLPTLRDAARAAAAPGPADDALRALVRAVGLPA